MTKTMKLTTTLAALVLFSGAALAQTAAPATPTTTTTPPKAPPAATAPATPAAPKAAAPAPAPAPAAVAPAATAPKAATPAPAATTAQTVNLNTAAESDLDKLPQVGPARAKAIVEARTKGGKFKNWDDFVARNIVPKNAEEAIKTLVKF